MRKRQENDTATGRAIALLEHVSRAPQPISVPDLIRQLKLPKPTVHRLAILLRQLGFLQRELGTKRLTIGPRLSSLALSAIMNSPDRGTRHAILRSVVGITHETCTLTILDGDEVLCVDRVESESPLRIQLGAGSRVPIHCTASGKLFLAMLPRAKRQRLLNSEVLAPYTERTISDPDQLERELESIRKERLSQDDQEYITGLIAIAVPALYKSNRICAAISLNAPAARMSLQQARQHVPALRRAAEMLARTFTEQPLDSPKEGVPVASEVS